MHENVEKELYFNIINNENFIISVSLQRSLSDLRGGFIALERLLHHPLN